MEGAYKTEEGVKISINDCYFVITVLAGYRYSFNPAITIFGDADPYFSIVVSGSILVL